MTHEFDHVALRVSELSALRDWFVDNLEYTVTGQSQLEDTESLLLEPTGATDATAGIELIAADTDSIDVGDGWGHIAVRVEDLYDAYEGLMDAGVGDYRDPDSCGGRYAFVKTPDGHEIELVEREIGPEWSIDHTMIRVEEADRALGYWMRKFEFDTFGRWEADTFANFFLKPADAPEEAMALELTYNYDNRSYTMGNGWDHLAIRVDDLGDAWERLELREADAYRSPADCAERCAYVHDPAGRLIQLVPAV